MSSPTKRAKGLSEAAYTFLQSFKKDGGFEKYDIEHFKSLSGETNDKTKLSFKEYIAKELVGKKTPNQMVANNTKHFCLDKVKQRMAEYLDKSYDQFEDLCQNKLGDYVETHDLAAVKNLRDHLNRYMSNEMDKKAQTFLLEIHNWYDNYQKGGKERDDKQRIYRYMGKLEKLKRKKKTLDEMEDMEDIATLTKTQCEKLEKQIKKLKQKFFDEYAKAYDAASDHEEQPAGVGSESEESDEESDGSDGEGSDGEENYDSGKDGGAPKKISRSKSEIQAAKGARIKERKALKRPASAPKSGTKAKKKSRRTRGI